MKRNAVAGTCLILVGVVFIGLQIHWRLLAKSTEENPYTFLDAIRKGTIGILNGNIVYVGDAAHPKDVHILTEQQFNTEFTEDERRAYEQVYAETQNLKVGMSLLPSRAEPQKPAQEVIKDKFQAMVEEPLSVIQQPVFQPTPPPLPPRPGQKQPVIEEEMLEVEQMPVEEMGAMPTPPPLPPRPEQQKTWQDEVREGVKLRPVSDRELPERVKELTYQDEIKKGVALKPAEERELAPKPEKPLTVLDEVRQFNKENLRPVEEQPERRPAPVGLSEQDAIRESLREKFRGSEDEEEEEGMTPEEMGFIPSAPSAYEQIQPERRPASNQGLLEQIRAGKQLNPVSQSSRPMPETQESAQSSLEKKVLQYQQAIPETDES